MSETGLLARLVTRLGNGMEQTLRWILRPFSTHSNKQRELLGESLHVGWSDATKAAVPLHAYTDDSRIEAMQEEILYQDLTTLGRVRALTCSPYEAARLLLFNDQHTGKVRCRYFTRVGPIRAILTSFDGQIRIGRGFRVQIRGQREPARLVICDKTLAKLIRDQEWRDELFHQVPVRTRNHKPKPPSLRKQLWDSTVTELREKCRTLGIKVSGNKREVIDRICDHSSSLEGDK